MKKLAKEFSGDYRVMRVIFSTSDPLKTLVDLQTTISYKRFIEYVEMLDAKVTLEEDTRRREAKKQERDRAQGK
jgi:hypothetical protein